MRQSDRSPGRRRNAPCQAPGKTERSSATLPPLFMRTLLVPLDRRLNRKRTVADAVIDDDLAACGLQLGEPRIAPIRRCHEVHRRHGNAGRRRSILGASRSKSKPRRNSSSASGVPATAVGGVVKTCASEPAPSVAISGEPSKPGIWLSSFHFRQSFDANPGSKSHDEYKPAARCRRAYERALERATWAGARHPPLPLLPRRGQALNVERVAGRRQARRRCRRSRRRAHRTARDAVGDEHAGRRATMRAASRRSPARSSGCPTRAGGRPAAGCSRAHRQESRRTRARAASRRRAHGVHRSSTRPCTSTSGRRP